MVGVMIYVQISTYRIIDMAAVQVSILWKRMDLAKSRMNDAASMRYHDGNLYHLHFFIVISGFHYHRNDRISRNFIRIRKSLFISYIVYKSM